MKLAVVQTAPVFGDVPENVEDAVELMETVDAADLFILPEFFNTGYNFADEKEVHHFSEPATGLTFQRIREFAEKKRCYVVYGFPERAERIYNSAALVGPEGLIGLYRKVHLYYRENVLFAPGDLGFPVFDLPFGKLGIMICFDWIYPESARTLALNGAQLIAHPSNLVLPYCPDAMVTRCLENRIFSATANRIGTESRGGLDLHFIGKSEIVSPSGAILGRIEGEKVGVLVTEVDLRTAQNKRINEFNDLFAGRRTGSYRVH